MAKKIGAIASLAIIGVLIIATIIMANINISYNINCETPNSIYVHYKNTNSPRYISSETQYNEILKLINSASKTNSLSALFNGSFNKEAQIKSVSGTKTVPTTSYFYVEYSYSTPQDLMVGNKKYEDSTGNTYTYDRLFFTVNDSSDSSIINVYVIPNGDKPTTYSHYYELEADFSNLYNYLMDNNLNA